MTAANALPDTALDPQGLARLQELDPTGQLGLVQRVLRTYLGSLERLAGQAGTACAAQHMEDLRYAAHTLKSSSASVGAARLAALCQLVERQAAAGGSSALPAVVQQLGAEAERVRVAVQALLVPQPAAA
jgi:HPt (histidine-containing phosphotransfer) domain-containing protein